PGRAIPGPPRRRKAAPHRRHGVVDQKISEHRVAEGPADERCHHRVSQGRVPLSQPKVRKILDTTFGSARVRERREPAARAMFVRFACLLYILTPKILRTITLTTNNTYICTIYI